MKGLGKQIRSIRREKNLTLVDVARRTGIDQATLSRIENGVMTGTVHSHVKIADVLGVALPDLYREAMVQINNTREKLAKRRMTTFASAQGVVAELLTSDISHKKMIPLLVKLKPNGRTETRNEAPGTECFLYVLKGSVDVIFGSDRQSLKAGEHIYFDSSVSHHFFNPVSAESTCLVLSSARA